MSTLALSARQAPAVVAAGGQVAFAANFPPLPVGGPYQGLFVDRVRAGVRTTFDQTGFTVSDAEPGGFTATLNTPAQAGDLITVYSALPAQRDVALTPGGAIQTVILEQDAMLTTARIQELRRDLAAAIADTLPAPAALPPGPYAARVAAAAAHVPIGAAFLSTAGYAVAGDGGEALYIPAVGASAGGFQSADGQWWAPVARQGEIDARVFGLAADGATDNHAAAVVAMTFAAAAGAVLVFAAGAAAYKFATSTTFTCPVAARGGAAISATTAIVLTFGAGFEAGLEQVFHLSGGASVAFAQGVMPVGQPEWWGAITGNAAIDNRAALTACVTACAKTQLQPADYWLGGRWQIATNHCEVAGYGIDSDGSAAGTRLLSSDASHSVVFIGTDAQPMGGINAFVGQVRLRDLTVVHVANPVGPIAGVLGGPACVECQFVREIFIERVTAYNGRYGFVFSGAVYSHLIDCHAQCLNLGSIAGNDFYMGCLLDGTPAIGANTGIASMYVRGLSVNGMVGKPSLNNALYTTNGFTDMFIERVESGACEYGLVFNGHPGTAFSSEDLQVRHCVLDQVSHVGITINAGEATTGAVIFGNYVGLAANGVGILVTGTPNAGTGSGIAIFGNQVITAAGGTTGLSVTSSRGVHARGNVWNDCVNPVILSNANNCVVADTITNGGQNAGTAAVQILNTSSRNVIDCQVLGPAGAFPLGVELLNTPTFNEVRCSGLDAGAITGGSANKLVSLGTQIVAAGTFSTNNLAQGIMA